jgi:hypothetical protein
VWGQFHTVSNLVLALVGKVDLLAAGIQWVKDVYVSAFHEFHRAQVFRKLITLCHDGFTLIKTQRIVEV